MFRDPHTFVAQTVTVCDEKQFPDIRKYFLLVSTAVNCPVRCQASIKGRLTDGHLQGRNQSPKAEIKPNNRTVTEAQTTSRTSQMFVAVGWQYCACGPRVAEEG